MGDELGRSWGGGDTEPLRLGEVFYSTVEHVCSCGLSLPIFVVLNDLLVEAGHDCVAAAEALEAAESLMPPRDLERGMMQIGYLLHRGDHAEAMVLAEGLVRRHPDRPECRFNAGYARQRMGDVTAALEHYRKAVELHPQLGDAWNNRGLLLQQVGRVDEARFCLARARQARGEPPPPDARTRLLEEAQGRFGSIRVIENEDLRALFIGSQCQGAMFLACDDDGPQPGPFCGSAFATGWLLAGCRHPAGRGLILGLGGGAGVITLLANFPKMRVTVVEIDPEVVTLALRHFPRLTRLVRQGRLEIVQADARELVTASDQTYDFVLLDAFTGDTELPPILRTPGFLARLGTRAKLVLANAIFTLGDSAQEAWLTAFGEASRPVVALYPVGAPEQWIHRPHNWILSTSRIDVPRSFAPFASSSHYLAQAMRNDFASMCARAIVVPPSALECVDGAGQRELEAVGEASV